MSVTVRDVARHCGVSIATVSRVINNAVEVSARTRDIVESAILQLGYVQSTPSIRSLQKSLRTIGLLMPDINNIHFPAVIRGMETYLFQKDYSLFVCNTDNDPGIERRYIESLVDKGVEALAFLATRHVDDSADHIQKISHRIPVIIIDDYLIGTNIYSVMNDEADGAYKAVNYLLELGHSRIAFISGSEGFNTSEYKKDGYLKALKHHAVPFREEYYVKTEANENGGVQAGNKLLDCALPPTAIFTENDQLAVGVMRAAFLKRLRVPRDLSIVGFSNSILAANLFPSLTSIDQSAEKTGELAAETVLRVINGEELIQRRIIIQPELVVRESTAQYLL